MLYILVICAAVFIPFAAITYFCLTQLKNPKWYSHSTRGHKNREKHQGLVPMVLGGATTLWRISESNDGMGNPRETHGFEFKNVEIPLTRSYHDTNLNLRGWHVIPKDDERKTTKSICIITVHGGGRDRRSFLRHIPLFHEYGCGVLMFDFEEHGISDGKQRGMGWCTYEPENVLSAVQFAKSQLGYESVVLVGTSIGASASIIAAGLGFSHSKQHKMEKTNEPRNGVDAIIAENPFITRSDLIRHVLNAIIRKSMGDASSSFFVRPLISGSINIIASFLLWALSDQLHSNALDAAKHIHVPILYIHGDSDGIIPYQHSEELYISTPSREKDLWIVPNAVHTGTQNVDPQEWNRRVLRLLDKVRKF